MSNPLYQMFRNNMGSNNIMNAVNQLKRTFKGDPQKTVQDMLNSGRISQEKYNRAMQMTQNIMRFMK
jgi:hypothetical protein